MKSFWLLVVVVLVAMAAVGVLVWASGLLPNVPPSSEGGEVEGLSVLDAYWVQDGFNVTETQPGEEVEAHVVVQSLRDDVNGHLFVHVKEPAANGSNGDAKTGSFAVSMEAGELKEFTVVFVANKLGFKTDHSFRGYHVEVEFNGKMIYRMPPDSPPALYVAKIEVTIPSEDD